MMTSTLPPLADEMTFREAVLREEMILTVFRQKDPAMVMFALRDAEQAHFQLKLALDESRNCHIQTPCGTGFWLGRKAGADTLVELPTAVLTAEANQQYLAEIFGARLLVAILGISEPRTDRAPVYKEIIVKVDSEWRPVVRVLHTFDNQWGWTVSE